MCEAEGNGASRPPARSVVVNQTGSDVHGDERSGGIFLSSSPGYNGCHMENAVRWRAFERIVQDIRERNADTDPDELQRIIDEIVSEVRAERIALRKHSGG